MPVQVILYLTQRMSESFWVPAPEPIEDPGLHHLGRTEAIDHLHIGLLLCEQAVCLDDTIMEPRASTLDPVRPPALREAPGFALLDRYIQYQRQVGVDPTSRELIEPPYLVQG
jgi:hypothetical protein